MLKEFTGMVDDNPSCCLRCKVAQDDKQRFPAPQHYLQAAARFQNRHVLLEPAVTHSEAQSDCGIGGSAGACESVGCRLCTRNANDVAVPAHKDEQQETAPCSSSAAD